MYDTLLQCDDMLGEDCIDNKDSKEDHDVCTHDDKHVPTDGGTTFDGQGLTNGGQCGFSYIFIVENGQPFGRAGLLLQRGSNLIQVPFILSSSSRWRTKSEMSTCSRSCSRQEGETYIWFAPYLAKTLELDVLMQDTYLVIAQGEYIKYQLSWRWSTVLTCGTISILQIIMAPLETLHV